MFTLQRHRPPTRSRALTRKWHKAPPICTARTPEQDDPPHDGEALTREQNDPPPPLARKESLENGSGISVNDVFATYKGLDEAFMIDGNLAATGLIGDHRTSGEPEPTRLRRIRHL